MMALVWPKLMPLGRLSIDSPAISATKGLVKPPRRTRAAASSSWPVPASPKMTTHSVSSSASNSSSNGAKPLPIIRSPPMEMKVLWPMFLRVRMLPISPPMPPEREMMPTGPLE